MPILRIVRRALAAIIGATLVSAIAATAASGSALADHFARYSAPGTSSALREFAACTVQRHVAAVQAVLRADLGVMTINAEYPDLVASDCLKPALFKNKKVTIVDGVYQAFLAESMLHRDYDAETLPEVIRVPPLQQQVIPDFDETKVSERVRTDFAIMRESAALDVVSECVARAAPKRVYLFVTGEPSSAPEAAGFAAVQSEITPCLHGGNVGSLPAFAWRIALARSLYLLVDRARPVPHEKLTSNA